MPENLYKCQVGTVNDLFKYQQALDAVFVTDQHLVFCTSNVSEDINMEKCARIAEMYFIIFFFINLHFFGYF